MNKILFFFSLIICSTNNAQIINAFAGGGTSGLGDGGFATAAQLSLPLGVTCDATGNVYIADQINGRVRMINNSGIISTFAGNGTGGHSGDGGQATAAGIGVGGITFDAIGNLYIADRGNYIRKVNTNGIISTIGGIGTAGYSGDGGPATAAEFNDPIGIAVDANGNVFIADNNNNRIRKINTTGIISTYAGTGYGAGLATCTACYSGDGGMAAAANLNNPWGLALDALGNLYIADQWNNCIRKVNTSGIITTVAGNGFGAGMNTVGCTTCYSGDGGPATSAELSSPQSIAFDAAGNMFIADGYNHRIRMVNTNGIINTVVGSGTNGCTGDGGPAIIANLGFPNGIAFDVAGNMYIDDINCSNVRKVCMTSCTSLGIESYSNKNNLAIYPNPANTTIHIDGSILNTEVFIYDVLGNEVFRSKVETINIDVSGLKPGVYFIKTTQGLEKFIKQ